MSSWYSSWLSGLPAFDFAVPSSIQRRFFSFLLRRTLGHFLKPGQLDLHQIDSQLGSGIVQVKDLELDGQAINQLLTGLPLSLYDGFISGVTARIPFPNPLSSSVGFRVQSLHLTFQVKPEHVSPGSPFFRDSSHLADSVVSVAETFIHDELTAREEAALRQTLLVDETEKLPGGFKPFGHNTHTEVPHEQRHGTDDPAGVSVFATLIERLLAKFEFSAIDTKVTIVYPARVSFTLSISEIAYRTTQVLRSEGEGKLQSGAEENNHPGQIRSVTISGLKVTSRDLHMAACSPTVTSTSSTPSFASSEKHSRLEQLSRNSSSSSSDADAQLVMSQSIAMLPLDSPTLSSVSGSMYQSAVSMAHALPITPDVTSASPSVPLINTTLNNVEQSRPRPPVSSSRRDSDEEDLLLSFGSQPIVLSLKTPSCHAKPLEQIPQGGDHPTNTEDLGHDEHDQETFQLSVKVGTLSCAFRSRHVCALLDIVDACISELPVSSPMSRKEVLSERSRTALCLEASVVVRAIVLIALPEPARGEVVSLDAFYERPIVPPRLPCTFLRFVLDTISISFQPFTSLPDPSMFGTPRTSSFLPMDRSTSAKFVVSDMSLFAFHAFSPMDASQVATPILITDHYLPTLDVPRHYRPSQDLERPEDIRLPEFEVVDWTGTALKSGSAKLSTWRSRNRFASRETDKPSTPSQGHNDLPSSPNPFMSSPLIEAEDSLPVAPAVEVSGWLVPASPSKEVSMTLDVKVAPLHLFFNLHMIFKDDLLLHFVDDVASTTMLSPKRVTDMAGSQVSSQRGPGEWGEDVDGERDNDIQQLPRRARDEERERKRLEALVIEDFNLGRNYRHTRTSNQHSSRQHSALSNQKKTGLMEPEFSLTCPMIRIEVRCAPPAPQLPRSGCMLLDIRGFTISTNPPSAKPPPRFSEGTSSPLPHLGNEIIGLYLQEMLVAYSSVGDTQAHTFLTLGFLPTKEVGPDGSTLLTAKAVLDDDTPLSILLGRPAVTDKSAGSSTNKFSANVHIPLLNLIMDKAIFDGLQCWADDAAQLVQRSFAASGNATETLLSRNPSLIGSRYFAQTRRSGTQSTDESVSENSGETVAMVSITEALLRFVVQRNGEFHQARPLDISAFGVVALVELKPEGREETSVSADVLDLHIVDTSTTGDYVLLIQSPARNFSSMPRPSVKARILSLAAPETTAKESRIKLSVCGLTVCPPFDGSFGTDLAAFAKAPPGVFESVVPSECTRLKIGVVDVSIHVHALGYPGAAALHLGEAEFWTELVGNSSEFAFKLSISSSHFFLVDSTEDASGSTGTRASQSPSRGVEFWKDAGYALIAEISHSQLTYRADSAISPPNISVVVERVGLQIHLCADTISALTGLITNMTRIPRDDTGACHSRVTPGTPDSIDGGREHDMTASLDEHAFKLIPEVGSTADMISDDLPANQDYLDASFGAAAGLRELRDDDLEDFDIEHPGGNTSMMGQLGTVSNVGGETIRIMKHLSFVEHYFDTISPDVARDPESDTTLRARVHDSDVALFLYDGFDWPRTRKIIEKEVKEMRKKLARIRQLVATGQTQEPIDEVTSTTLFNSFHIGLERDLETMDSDALIAAIDDELDDSAETGTESSWQSLHPASPGRPRVVSTRVHGKRLTRSRGPSIEIRLDGLNAEIDNYRPGDTVVSRTLILVRDLEILDHIKTSTWKKFLTDMRADSRGNTRETNSNMARVELLSVRPSPSHSAEEARLKAKLLPLRLYVDQDALDFFKKFFAFQDPDSASRTENGGKNEEIYFQHAEVFPVDIKLDYKPRRVDYRALRDGRTIELMNFFHFDGAEMTLRHLTLHGITGWPRLFDTLNDLWTPDVKATQLVDVISGVAPIRSVVNVGSGVADLVLLPIAQYKKDGRIVRGLQKGTKAFFQSTAMEAIKLGARLATGTQVILEQAENVLGGQFKDSITAEALQIPYENEDVEGSDEDLISRYAAQPTGLREGVQSAYHSLQRNLHSAAQTILAVPMEVYERSGNEGAVRAVVRAVPIAVLKPMIGASEAVSKTLMGLHNTLDPNIRLENEAKYKHH